MVGIRFNMSQKHAVSVIKTNRVLDIDPVHNCDQDKEKLLSALSSAQVRQHL